MRASSLGGRIVGALARDPAVEPPAVGAAATPAAAKQHARAHCRRARPDRNRGLDRALHTRISGSSSCTSGSSHRGRQADDPPDWPATSQEDGQAHARQRALALLRASRAHLSSATRDHHSPRLAVIVAVAAEPGRQERVRAAGAAPAAQRVRDTQEGRLVQPIMASARCAGPAIVGPIKKLHDVGAQTVQLLTEHVDPAGRGVGCWPL